MEKFPTLKTPRLVLNQPMESDLDNLVQYLSETSEFSDNTLTMPFPYTRENGLFFINRSAEDFKNGDAYIFAIREKDNLQLMGAIGIHLENPHRKAMIGYWLAKDFWNRGYITEALQCLLKFGFDELNLNKIYATHYPHNPASGKVMEKCGMKKEAVLKEEYCKNGVYLDAVRYAILHQDFSALD